LNMVEKRELNIKDVLDALVLTLSPKPFREEEKLSIIDDFLTILQRKGLITSEEIMELEEAYLKEIKEFDVGREIKKLAEVG